MPAAEAQPADKLLLVSEPWAPHLYNGHDADPRCKTGKQHDTHKVPNRLPGIQGALSKCTCWLPPPSVGPVLHQARLAHWPSPTHYVCGEGTPSLLPLRVPTLSGFQATGLYSFWLPSALLSALPKSSWMGNDSQCHCSPNAAEKQTARTAAVPQSQHWHMSSPQPRPSGNPATVGSAAGPPNMPAVSLLGSQVAFRKKCIWEWGWVGNNKKEEDSKVFLFFQPKRQLGVGDGWGLGPTGKHRLRVQSLCLPPLGAMGPISPLVEGEANIYADLPPQKNYSFIHPTQGLQGDWGTQTHPCFCEAPRQEKQGTEMRQLQCGQTQQSQRKAPITWDSMGRGAGSQRCADK